MASEQDAKLKAIGVPEGLGGLLGKLGSGYLDFALGPVGPKSTLREGPAGTVFYSDPDRPGYDAETDPYGLSAVYGGAEDLPPMIKVHEMGHVAEGREGSRLQRMGRGVYEAVTSLPEMLLEGKSLHEVAPFEQEGFGRGVRYLSRLKDDPKASELLEQTVGLMRRQLEKGDDPGGYLREAYGESDYLQELLGEIPESPPEKSSTFRKFFGLDN